MNPSSRPPQRSYRFEARQLRASKRFPFLTASPDQSCSLIVSPLPPIVASASEIHDSSPDRISHVNPHYLKHFNHATTLRLSCRETSSVVARHITILGRFVPLCYWTTTIGDLESIIVKGLARLMSAMLFVAISQPPLGAFNVVLQLPVLVEMGVSFIVVVWVRKRKLKKTFASAVPIPATLESL
jgi:hypothetical protein